MSNTSFNYRFSNSFVWCICKETLIIECIRIVHIIRQLYFMLAKSLLQRINGFFQLSFYSRLVAPTASLVAQHSKNRSSAVGCIKCCTSTLSDKDSTNCDCWCTTKTSYASSTYYHSAPCNACASP